MQLLHSSFLVAVLAIATMACSGTEASDDVAAAVPDAPAPVAAAPEPPSASRPAAAATAGTARVRLTGAGVDIDGEFPATICNGAFGVGEGVAYQVQAGEWKITVGSGKRLSGDVPLNDESGDVNVAVTANGPGRQLVRGPRNGGSLRISDDYNLAEADLELRPLLGGETAQLVATFTCTPDA